METVFNEVVEAIKTYLPSFIGALAILVAGWVIAMIVAGLVRGLLKKSASTTELTPGPDLRGWRPRDIAARELDQLLITMRSKKE